MAAYGKDPLAVAMLGIVVVVSALIPYHYGQFLVALVLASGVWSVLRGRPVPRTAVFWSVLLGAWGAAAIAFGMARSNPGAFVTFGIFVVEPVVFGLVFGSFSQVTDWRRRLIGVLDLALMTVATVGLLVYVAHFLHFSLPAFLVDPDYTTVDLDGKIRTNFQGFNSLVFLAAYGLWRAVASTAPRWWRIALGAAALGSLVLSGRRILLIAVPVALTVTWLLARTSRSTLARRLWSIPKVATLSVGAAVAGAVALTVGALPAGVLTKAAAAINMFDPSDPRHEQSDQLLDAWARSPLFGQGAGAVLNGYVRSVESPWAFELSYHMLLMNFGLLGALVVASWVAWTGWRLVLGVRHGDDVAGVLLCGLISLLVSVTVDPYLYQADGMWMIFVPFAAAVAMTRAVRPLEAAQATTRGRAPAHSRDKE